MSIRYLTYVYVLIMILMRLYVLASQLIDGFRKHDATSKTT